MDLEALLAERPARRRHLGDWYSKLLAAAEGEGSSVPQLARRLGCSSETIYSWRRRLRKDGPSRSLRQAGLVRVQVLEPRAEPAVERVEVRTRTGYSVLVPSNFEPSVLAAVVATLDRC